MPRISFSPRLSWRVLLGKIHLWIGVTLCVPLAVLGITGSILMFEDEINRLVSPEHYQATSGETRSLDEIVAAAREADPGATPSFVSAPDAPGAPAIVRVAPAGRPAIGPGGMQVFVDPVTLRVLGVNDPSTGVMRQIFFLHANFMARDRSGRELVGWLGVAMLILGCSGLVLWWPRRGAVKAAFTVDPKARGLRLHRQVHGAMGIWGLVVFMLVSFSGAYLSFPQFFGDAVRLVAPGRDMRAQPAPRVTPTPGGQQITIEAAVALARETVPGTELRAIFLNPRPDQPVRVSLAPPGYGHGAPLVTTLIDPWVGKVIDLRDPRTYTAGETFLSWQHALHAGEGLGIVWWVLVFLSGFMPPLFVITGVSMWLLKRRARRRSLQPAE